MTFKAKVASALSFAHLAGPGRGKAAAAAEDDDEKKDRDHEDGDVKKAKKADADEPEKDDKDKKEDARAEDDDPDANAADDKPGEGDDEDDKKDKSKAAKADDGDDDDEKMKAGARKEKARIGSIFASPAAARNIALAAELACNTDLTAAQAIAILGKAPAAAAGHPNRAAANPRVGSGGVPEVTGKQAVDSGWDRAFAHVNPQRRK